MARLRGPIFAALAALFLASPAGAQPDPVDERVWQSTVSLFWPTNGCTGVVVAPDVVLTAGHCVLFDDARRGDVRLDFFVGSEKSVAVHRSVADYRILRNKAFVPELRLYTTDLALVVFREDVLPETHRPAQILSERDGSPRRGQAAIMAGTASTDPSVRERRLRTMKGTIGSFLRDAGYVETQDGGVCFGDSGGPLFVDIDGDLRLAGILSEFLVSDFVDLRDPRFRCSSQGGVYTFLHRETVFWVEHQSRRLRRLLERDRS